MKPIKLKQDFNIVETPGERDLLENVVINNIKSIIAANIDNAINHNNNLFEKPYKPKLRGLLPD